MDIDANVKKIVTLLLKKWKIIVLFALIGTLAAYFYTANFTTLTYSSSVEFLATAYDATQEFSDSTTQSVSNTSKMNYAMKMLDTYLEIFKTNEFNQSVAEELNKKYSTNYSGSTVKGAVSISKIENTAMFRITVTTTDANLSYDIARQLEKSIPDVMDISNSGLVTAEVKDKAIKPTASESLNYPKKCLVGFIIGAALAAVYVVLRDLLDVRIRSSEELVERYEIPVLGSIPEFEIKNPAPSKTQETRGDVK